MPALRRSLLVLLPTLVVAGCGFSDDDLQLWDCTISAECDGRSVTNSEQICESVNSLEAAKKQAEESVIAGCTESTVSIACTAKDEACEQKK